jgi:tetratricopeptide (TPR) repeat protein
VRKDNKRNRVRITAQLVNVEDGYHLWSETYDRDLEDIFAIQEEIARKVAQALRITLLGEDEVRIADQAVTDLNAYDLYLQGLQAFNEYSFASLEQAVKNFGKAIELDPEYVPAQLLLAQAWLELSQTGVITRSESLDNATPLLEKILLADPRNSDAHANMARVHRYSLDFPAAEQEFHLALDTNPRNVYALSSLGRLYLDSGKVARGMEYLQEAGRIDPYSVQVLWNLSMAHAFKLEPEKARDYTRRIGEVQPDNPMRYYGPGIAHGLVGNLAQSVFMDLKAIPLDPDDYELAAGVASDWAMLGDLEQAEIWARKADETGADQPVPILARVMIYQAREQHGLAADLAKRALDRELDNRQASNAIFRHTWVSSLVAEGKISAALAFYNDSFPQAFQNPPDLNMDSSRRFMQLVEIATLLQMQDPGSPQAKILLDAAEQKIRLVESKWIPWFGSVRLAAIATARGDKSTAIEHLLGVKDNRFGSRWRNWFITGFVFAPLHDEPEYKQLVANLEADMQHQREEVYELLGMTK